MLVVVGAALLDPAEAPRRVLLAQRDRPPELAGRWEFAGDKVEPGETEAAALVRECREELGVAVRVGVRLGPDLRTAAGALLRVYVAYVEAGAPIAVEHRQVRWHTAAELDAVDWIPADRPLVPALRALLGGGG